MESRHRAFQSVAIHNEFGNLKATFSKKFEVGTNKGAELQLLISGIRLYKTLGIENIIIEIDFELVVGWIRKNLCSSWYLWDFLEHLRDEL